MTRSLQELSDRVDLSDLITRYATCIDCRDFAGLDEVFTPDAHLDYSASDGATGEWPEVRTWLSEVLPLFTSTQHLVSNLAVELDGDQATGRCMCLNPMRLDGDGGTQVLFYGLWYSLTFARVDDVWRITSLTQERSFDRTL